MEQMIRWGLFEMKKDEKVTIRINGEQVPFNENYKVNDWQQAQAEMSATIDEGVEEEKYQVNIVKATKQSIQKPTLLILSVLAAIFIGLFFGFVLLSLMQQDDTKVNTQTPIIDNQPKNEDKPKDQIISKKLNELNIVGLQANIFSTEEAANTFMNELKKNEQIAAAIFKQNEQFSVIVGLSVNIDDGKKLITKKEDGMNGLYAKELFLPGVEREFPSELAFEQYSELVSQHREMIQLYYALQLNQEVKLERVEALIEKLNKMEAQNLSEALVKQVDELKKSVQSMKQLIQKDEKAKMVEVEQSLLNFFNLYSK